MTLLRDWDGRDLSGWLAAEKFNGCRGYWDGRRMWTRDGNVIPLPDWFRAELPAGFPLDGEVWCGRNGFTEARLAVQYGKFTRRVRFVVFDAPRAKGNWQARMAAAAAAVRGSTVTRVARFRVLRGARDARALLREIRGRGGEGVVVRNPHTPRYERKRSWNVMRIKRWPRTFNALMAA